MSKIKGRLSDKDHLILILLIRGWTQEEISIKLKCGKSYVNQTLGRMKDLCECRTLYELISLETINLMESENDLRLQLLFKQAEAPPPNGEVLAATA